MKEDEVARSKLSENTTNTKSPVEANINEIAETLVRLHILNYLDVDEEGEKRIVEAAVSELQSIATNLQTRWKKVNYVNFLTQTVVIQLTKHFEAQQVYFSNQDKNCSFVTFSHLQSEESEEVYVRRLAVLMVRFLLPAQYQRTSLSRTLAEDILTNLIILPIINKITDPHFINQQCIAILKEENIERLSSESSPGITADKTEDDLLSLKDCEDRKGEGETLQSHEGQGDFYQTADRLYNSHLSRLQTVIYQILIISRLVFMSLSVTFTSQLLEAVITLSLY